MNRSPVYLIESEGADKTPVFLVVKHDRVLPANRSSRDEFKDVFFWGWSGDSQRAIKFADKHSAEMVLCLIQKFQASPQGKEFVSEHIFC